MLLSDATEITGEGCEGRGGGVICSTFVGTYLDNA